MYHSISQNKYIHRILRTPGPVTASFAPKCRDTGAHGEYLQQSILETLVLTYTDEFLTRCTALFITFEPVDEGIWLHVTLKKYYNNVSAEFSGVGGEIKTRRYRWSAALDINPNKFN